MTLNDILALTFLVCAVVDTLGAQYILPRMLDRQPMFSKAEQRRVISFVNAGALVFFAAGTLMYFFKPLR